MGPVLSKTFRRMRDTRPLFLDSYCKDCGGRGADASRPGRTLWGKSWSNGFVTKHTNGSPLQAFSPCLASIALESCARNGEPGLLARRETTAWFVLWTFFTVRVVRLGIVVEDAVSGPIGTASP